MSDVLNGMVPLGLNEVSRRLGVDPFEAVRLLIATGQDLTGPLSFPAEVVEDLRDRGGVQDSWWADAELVADADPKRQRVRTALQLMLERGHVGERTTRMDNVWRGLSYEDQALLQGALAALTKEGLLLCVGTPIGLQVSIEVNRKADVEKLAKGKASSDGLDALFQG